MTKDQVSGSSDLPSFVDDRLRPGLHALIETNG